MTRIDTPTGWVRRLVAVIITMTATMAALVGASAPASAEACSSSSGVSVVVDSEGATGGVQSACVATGANRPAHEIVTAAGFALTWVQRQPGFICQVNGAPAESTCVNTPPPDAYWGLFWSDGKDGAWHYADVGATGLEVPDGGYIGLAWQTGTRRVPGQEATVHPTATATATPTPTPTPTSTAPAPTSPTSGTSTPTTKPTTKPSTNPTKKPTPKPSTTPPSAPTTSGSVTTTPTTATPSTTDPSASDPTGSTTESPTGQASEPAPSNATESPSPSETSVATETPTDGAVPPEARTDEESSRVPTWLTLTILASLIVAIGMSAYAARRRTRH